MTGSDNGTPEGAAGEIRILRYPGAQMSAVRGLTDLFTLAACRLAPHDRSMTRCTVRDSRPEDVPALTAIYGHWVEHGVASFELAPPDEDEMARRREAVLAGGYPHLTAEEPYGGVVGYAYASAYRTRPAYRHTVENSVYVAPGAGRRGAGRALLAALIARCEAMDFRLTVAVIGDSGNAPSIGLHAALGFRHAGVLPAIGWKHGRWLDSVLMVRPLGPGNAAPPGGP